MYTPHYPIGKALVEQKQREALKMRRPRLPARPGDASHRRRKRASVAKVAALTVACLVIAGCSTGGNFERVEGSGRMESETRTVSNFDHIVVSGGGTVTVEITGTESLVIEAEDSLLEVLRSDVVDGKLMIGAAPYVNVEPTREIIYRITAAELDGISVSGSASIRTSFVESDRFEVVIAGSGLVEPVGTVVELAVEIGGSGKFEGSELISQKAAVAVAGSGQALVNATDELEASVSGSGHIGYLGDPAVRLSVSGSGSIDRG